MFGTRWSDFSTVGVKQGKKVVKLLFAICVLKKTVFFPSFQFFLPEYA